MFHPPQEVLELMVCGGLQYGCEVGDYSDTPAILALWDKVESNEKSPEVLATLIVDFCYRKYWMPAGTVPADWNYEGRVKHIAEHVIPALAGQ